MMRFVRLCAALLLLCAATGASHAQDDLRALIGALAGAKFEDTEKAVQALAATGDAQAVPALEALAEGNLYTRKADGAVLIATKGSGRTLVLIDPVTGDTLGEAQS